MLFMQKALNSSDVTCTISTKPFLCGRKIGTSRNFRRSCLSSSACVGSLPSEQGITNSTSLVALRLLLHCRGEYGAEGGFSPSCSAEDCELFHRYVLSKSSEKTCCAVQRTDDEPGVLIKHSSALLPLPSWLLVFCCPGLNFSPNHSECLLTPVCSRRLLQRALKLL